MNVQFFTKDHCQLCDDGEIIMNILKYDWKFEFEKINIYEDDALLEKYQLMIPVVVIDGVEVDYGRISIEKVEQYFRERQKSL